MRSLSRAKRIMRASSVSLAFGAEVSVRSIAASPLGRNAAGALAGFCAA